jgi:hypothetical protein
MVWLGRGAAAGLVCVGVLLVTPEARAGHCDYCTESRPHDVVFPLTEIGSDGVVVIVLADYSHRLIDESWWEHVVVSVTDDAGAPVDGELELHSGFTPATWRPSEPWIPGSFEVKVVVDLEAGGEPCVPIEVVAPLLVLATPTAPHPAFTVATSETHSLVPRFELSTLVCCDGALPYRPSVQGVICPSHPPPRPEIGTGFCTELIGRGRLLVETVVEPVVAADSPLLAVREVTAGDRPTTSGAQATVVLESPGCIELEILDLLTGVRTSFPSCHGDELGNQLGEVALDPAPSLVESCVGEPYVCEVIASDRWDPDACTRWPDGATLEPFPDASSETATDADADTEHAGSGCSLPAGSAPPCAWLLIAGIMRRRSRRPSTHESSSRTSSTTTRFG